MTLCSHFSVSLYLALTHAWDQICPVSLANDMPNKIQPKRSDNVCLPLLTCLFGACEHSFKKVERSKAEHGKEKTEYSM